MGLGTVAGESSGDAGRVPVVGEKAGLPNGDLGGTPPAEEATGGAAKGSAGKLLEGGNGEESSKVVAVWVASNSTGSGQAAPPRSKADICEPATEPGGDANGRMGAV